VRSGPREKQLMTKKKGKKKSNDQQQKEMDYDEPHIASNEKMQPIQWTK